MWDWYPPNDLGGAMGQVVEETDISADGISTRAEPLVAWKRYRAIICCPLRKSNKNASVRTKFGMEASRGIRVAGSQTAYITPGSLWENGYVESFNARLRDELLNGEFFYTLKEAQIIIESWRRHYNTIRVLETLGYRPLAPDVFVPALTARPAALA